MATGRVEVTACVRSPLGGLRIVRPDGLALEGPVGAPTGRSRRRRAARSRRLSLRRRRRLSAPPRTE
ncbi:hypothetical protein [Streptomyces sp. NBC_01549]|uniref:hypothetical protein n=1 Tax=Streptomyces sp. NBC_01549 TaxID=2975874 RepID=UPI00338E250E